MRKSIDYLHRSSIPRSLLINFGGAAAVAVALFAPTQTASADTGHIDSICDYVSRDISIQTDPDCDGIVSRADRFPLIREVSNDVDGDFMPNMFDLYPYSKEAFPIAPEPQIVVPAPGAGTPTAAQAPASSYYPGAWNDILNTDRDNDGIPNAIDPHPDNRDYDNDGRIDGDDKDTLFNQDRLEEQRLEAKRLQQKQLEQQQEAKRQEQRRQEQKAWDDKIYGDN